MAYYDLATINTAIEETLTVGQVAGLKRSQDVDELSDNIPESDLPLLQVVPQSWGDGSFSQTQVNTFTGHGTNSQAFKTKEWIFDVYVYVSTLSKIRVGMQRLVTIASAIEEIIDGQENLKHPFGQEAIRSFTHQSERININYSGVDLLCIHITITCNIF